MRNVLLLELISRELVSRDNSSDSIACVPINNNIKLLCFYKGQPQGLEDSSSCQGKNSCWLLFNFCLIISMFLFYLKFVSDKYDMHAFI